MIIEINDDEHHQEINFTRPETSAVDLPSRRFAMTKRPSAMRLQKSRGSSRRAAAEGDNGGPSINRDYSMYENKSNSNNNRSHLPSSYECPYAQKKPPLP